ncbi:MAG: hypothetical protein ABW224_07930 [Kibdelosporangium sp.]
MSRPLDIGLDIDGVLYPFVKVIADYATNVLGRDCSDQAGSWDWYKHQWGLTTEEFFALCGRGVNDGVLYTEGAPLPGALPAVRTLAQAGHRIHYISARAISGVPVSLAWHRTAEWLSRWDFPVDSLTITEDKAARPTDVFLDDSPHMCDMLLAARHPRPVLWCHSRTQTHTADRVFTWAEFLAIVDAEAGIGSALSA